MYKNLIRNGVRSSTQSNLKQKDYVTSIDRIHTKNGTTQSVGRYKNVLQMSFGLMLLSAAYVFCGSVIDRILIVELNIFQCQAHRYAITNQLNNQNTSVTVLVLKIKLLVQLFKNSPSDTKTNAQYPRHESQTQNITPIHFIM